MPFDKIICLGKNYWEHAQELGDAAPEKPVIFLKPPSILKQAMHWKDIVQARFPQGDTNVQPECEIVLKINAQHDISHITLGLEMTLRDRQTQLKKNGHPWTTAKVFRDAAIIGPWIAIADFPHFMETPFSLKIDGKTRQSAKGNDMRMNPQEMLRYIDAFFPLGEGDLIFTGTPAGVSAIHPASKAKLTWGQYHYEVAFT